MSLILLVFRLQSLVEHLYDYGMLSPAVAELVDVVKRLEMAVDADDLEAVLRAREMLLAYTMAPLAAFDDLRLYQPSKAASTQQFLERTVGLSPGDAHSTVAMARKLKAMPLTEAAWLAGILTSGQVRAVVGNVSTRTAEQYRAQEADVLAIIVALDGKDTVKAMQSWANYAEALLADDPEKPPREDEFFHSQTTGGRYAATGNFAAVTGAVIAKAIELAEDRQSP